MSVLHPIRSHRERCGEARAALSDYLDRDLAPADRRRVEAHLGRCSRCRRVLASLGRTVGALRRLGADERAA